MNNASVINENIEINEVVYYRHIKGDFVSLHKHSLWEIQLYCDGKGRVGFLNEEYEYDDNTVVIVAPERDHSENALSKTDVYCCVLSLPEGFDFSSAIHYCNSRNRKILQEIKKILWNMANLWFKERKEEFLPPLFEADESVSMQDYSMARVFCMINLIETAREQRGGGEYKKNMVAYAQSYIKSHFADAVDYRILAEKIGYSYEHFRAFFKKMTGITLKQYQLGIQLSQAKFYLSHTKQKVKWIAKKCGFRSDVRFMICFKEKFGVSPSDYRKLMRRETRVVNINEKWS